MYSNASASIRAVGNIFPVVLYAVAAMVTFTTMTRLWMKSEHMQVFLRPWVIVARIIIAKFLLYGLVAGTVGTALGSILFGHYLLAGVFQVSLQKTWWWEKPRFSSIGPIVYWLLFLVGWLVFYQPTW